MPVYPIDVQIDGKSVVSGGLPGAGYWIDQETLQIQEDPAHNQFELDCDLILEAQSTPYPKGGQEIIVLGGVGQGGGPWREFGGVIQAAGPKLETPNGTMRYTIKAIDYRARMDRHLVNDSYSEQAADQIVIAIVANYANQGIESGKPFTTNNVQAAPSVPNQRFSYVEPSKAITQLANLLQWTFYVDYDRDVHFGPYDIAQSPLPGNTMLPDTDFASFSDLDFTPASSTGVDSSQLKSRVIVLGFQVDASESITQTFTGDGQRDTFALAYNPSTPLASKVTVSVGGVGYAVKPDISAGTQPTYVAGTAYVDHQTNSSPAGVRFLTAPGIGVAVVVTYFYRYKPVHVVDDPVAIAAQAAIEGTDGVYEYKLTESRATSQDTTLAEAFGQFVLNKYSYPLVAGQFTSYLQGWRAGQWFYFTSDLWFDGAYQGVKFWVSKITKKIAAPANGPTLVYTVEIANRPFAF